MSGPINWAKYDLENIKEKVEREKRILQGMGQVIECPPEESKVVRVTARGAALGPEAKGLTAVEMF